MSFLWLAPVFAAGADPAAGRPTVPALAPDAKPPYVAARFTRLSAASATTANGPARFETTDHQLAIGVAAFRPGTYAVDIALDYQYSRYEYDGIASRNRDQHRLQAPIRFRGRGEGGDWRFDAHVTPGVSTSSNVFQDPLDRWTSDDLTLAAGAEWQYRIAPRWRAVAGIAHDRTLGESATYPIAGLRHVPNDRLSLRLAFPDSELRYAPARRQELTARMYPAGHEWHVVSDTLERDFDYRLRAWRAEGTWSWRLWRSLTVDLTLGYEFGRRHRFTNDAGARVDADVDDQWLASFGLRVGQAPLPHAHGLR